jgi:uncharacterized protein (DUF433 family)
MRQICQLKIKVLDSLAFLFAYFVKAAPGTMSSIDHQQCITQDPQVRNGEPCIRGLPITVFEIIGRLGVGRTFSQILADYPQLTRADIMACVDFGEQQSDNALD